MPLGVAACALIAVVYRGTDHLWFIIAAVFLLFALAALRVGTAIIVDHAARRQRPGDRQN
jgi:predicted lysophospholipase L1 biosynthesis ABC-type transport system permease subunit